MHRVSKDMCFRSWNSQGRAPDHVQRHRVRAVQAGPVVRLHDRGACARGHLQPPLAARYLRLRRAGHPVHPACARRLLALGPWHFKRCGGADPRRRCAPCDGRAARVRCCGGRRRRRARGLGRARGALARVRCRGGRGLRRGAAPGAKVLLRQRPHLRPSAGLGMLPRSMGVPLTCMH